MSSTRKCAFPDCEKSGTKTCTGCGEIGYCSKEHQIAHWKTHKGTCKQKHKTAAASASKGEDVPVTWADQQRINEFSRLNLALQKLDDDLKAGKNDAANLEDAANDIDSLLDDDACKVRIGEVFMDVSNEEAEEFVKEKKAAQEKKQADLVESRKQVIKQMDELKTLLYQKFGKQINLENAEQTRED